MMAAMNNRDHHLDEVKPARRISDPAGWSRHRSGGIRAFPAWPACRIAVIAAARVVRASRCRRRHAGARQSARARSERALPTKPVTVVVHVSFSVSLPLASLFVSVWASAFSGS
jgi:hypothetical protein